MARGGDAMAGSGVRATRRPAARPRVPVAGALVLAVVLAAGCTETGASGSPPGAAPSGRPGVDVGAGPNTPGPDGSPTLRPSVPVVDGVTQPVLSYPEAVRERVSVRTGLDRDGDGVSDVVALDVVRPAQTRTGLRVPVVLEASPYYADLGRGPENQTKTVADDGTPQRFPLAYDNYLVPRGYAVALLDLPGTGASGGCLDYGGPGDVDAVVAALDWLAGRGPAVDAGGAAVRATWSTGAVAMVGKSYDGYVAGAAAARGVPGLRTVVAIAAPSSVYDYVTGGGVRVGPNFLVGFVDERSARPRQACAVTRAALDTGEGDETGLWSPFWAARDLRPRAGDVRAAMFLVHGLGDRNVLVDQATRWWTALGEAGVPRRMWLLEAGHVDPFDVRREVWLDTLHRWLDHWLQGVENGVDAHPLVTVEEGDGSWRQSTAWPDPAAAPALLPLPALVTAPLQQRGVPWSPPPPVRLVGGPPGDPDDLLRAVLPTRSEGAAPDRDVVVRQDAGVVVLRSAPLRADLRLGGTVRVRVLVRGASPDPALLAALVDLGPARRPDLAVGTEGIEVDQGSPPSCIGEPAPGDDGCFRRTRPVTIASGAGRLTAGWRRLGLDGDGSLQPLRAGADLVVGWDLAPLDRVVPAGRRLGLVLFAARPLPDAVLPGEPAPAVVDLRAVTVTLPVVGGQAALDAALG